MSFCKKCGNKLDESNIYCNKCGSLVVREEPKKVSSLDINVASVDANKKARGKESNVFMWILSTIFVLWFGGIAAFFYLVEVQKLPDFIINDISIEAYPKVVVNIKKLNKKSDLKKENLKVYENGEDIINFSLDNSNNEIKLIYTTTDESLEEKKVRVLIGDIVTGKKSIEHYKKSAKQKGKMEVVKFDYANYPEIKSSLSILDESGKEIEGLTESNLSVTENNNLINDLKVTYDGKYYSLIYNSQLSNYSGDVQVSFKLNSQIHAANAEYKYELKSKSEEYRDFIDNLENFSKTVLSKIDGDYSVYFKDLESTESLTINNKRNISASTIKTFIMVEAYDQIKNSVINENDSIILTNEMKAGGSGILAEKPEGEAYTIKQLIDLMMTQSDNTAANILIDTLGMDNINDEIRKIGASDTKLNRKMMDQTAIARGIENYTSVKDLGLVLEKLYNGECIDKTYDSIMLDIMKNNKMRYKITNELPSGVEASSKSGEYTGVENDSAIIYTDKGAYILCITTSNGNSLEQVNAIKKISTKIYNEYLSYKS